MKSSNQEMMQPCVQEEVFAKGLCGKKLFFLFVIFSVFGAYYEQILNLVTHYLKDGSIFWEYRRGVFYGPFSPIYGAGAILIIYLLAKKEYSNSKVFIYGSLLGGFFEYAISFLQEVFTGTTSWNYSQHFLSIGGRTTIPFMLVWGLLSFLLVKGIYPVLSSLIEKIPRTVGNVLFLVLCFFMTVNMLLSWTALIRGTLRRQKIPPLTPVGRMYDEVYPDSYLQEKFPNMDFEPLKRRK